MHVDQPPLTVKMPDLQGEYVTDASWDGTGNTDPVPTPHIMNWCARVTPAFAADMAAALAAEPSAIATQRPGDWWGSLHLRGEPVTDTDIFLRGGGSSRPAARVGEGVAAVLQKLMTSWHSAAQSLPVPAFDLLVRLRPSGEADPPSINFEIAFVYLPRLTLAAPGTYSWPGTCVAIFSVAKGGAVTAPLQQSILGRQSEKIGSGSLPATAKAPVRSGKQSAKTIGPLNHWEIGRLNYWPANRRRGWIRYAEDSARRPNGYPRDLPSFVEIAEPSLKRLRVVANAVAQFALNTAQACWNPTAMPGEAWTFELDLTQRSAADLLPANARASADMSLWLQQVLDRLWQRIDALRLRDAACGHGWLLPTHIGLQVQMGAHSQVADEAKVVMGFPNGCSIENRVVRGGDTEAPRFPQ